MRIWLTSERWSRIFLIPLKKVCGSICLDTSKSKKSRFYLNKKTTKESCERHKSHHIRSKRQQQRDLFRTRKAIKEAAREAITDLTNLKLSTLVIMTMLKRNQAVILTLITFRNQKMNVRNNQVNLLFQTELSISMLKLQPRLVKQKRAGAEVGLSLRNSYKKER